MIILGVLTEKLANILNFSIKTPELTLFKEEVHQKIKLVNFLLHRKIIS